MSETPHAEQSPAEQPQDPSGPSWSHGPWAPQSQIGPAEVPRVTWTPGTTGGDRLHDALDSDGSATPPVDAAPTDTPTGQPSLAGRVRLAQQATIDHARQRVAQSTSGVSNHPVHPPAVTVQASPVTPTPAQANNAPSAPGEDERVRMMAEDMVRQQRASMLARQMLLEMPEEQDDVHMSEREKMHRQHLMRKKDIDPDNKSHLDVEVERRMLYTLNAVESYARKVAAQLLKEGIRPNSTPTHEQLSNVNMDRGNRGMSEIKEDALQRLMGFNYRIQEPYQKVVYGVASASWRDSTESVNMFVVEAFGKRDPRYTSNPNANPPYFFDGGWGFDSNGRILGCYYDRARVIKYVKDPSDKSVPPKALEAAFKMFRGATRHTDLGKDKPGEGYVNLILDAENAMNEMFRSLTGKAFEEPKAANS